MTGTGPIRILLADDQPLLRMGFRLILEGEDDLSVVGEASDGGEAVGQVRDLAPDVVLMDVRMPVLDGIEATRAITASGAHAKVIILTTFDLDEYAFAGLQAGASAFLLKDVAPAELISAVRVVASGDAVVAPRVTRRLLEEYVRGNGAGNGAGTGGAGGMPGAWAPSGSGDAAGPGSPAGARPAKDPLLEDLTAREAEMLGAMAEGLSNAEIAHRYFLSEATVKTHVRRILSKLHLRDRVQAVVYAYETGLVVPSNPDY
ncbi:response regulator transcription factor [Arthrobacter sp. PsM3]|uniref:response regulator transcription factor n=1 Tax=Arthrobacter sp. PsM3 TaxID=3030531 RepID=UPI00263BAC2E|nr:response regulator transcription factor [Arthrobacter sp. PsM3]MDN4643275.1 response regulator transcription factor [Arthrobacter sp. PsM3]